MRAIWMIMLVAVLIYSLFCTLCSSGRGHLSLSWYAGMNELAVACCTQCAASLFLTEQRCRGSGEPFPLFKKTEIERFLRIPLRILEHACSRRTILPYYTLYWQCDECSPTLQRSDSHEQVLFSDSQTHFANGSLQHDSQTNHSSESTLFCEWQKFSLTVVQFQNKWLMSRFFIVNQNQVLADTESIWLNCYYHYYLLCPTQKWSKNCYMVLCSDLASANQCTL